MRHSSGAMVTAIYRTSGGLVLHSLIPKGVGSRKKIKVGALSISVLLDSQPRESIFEQDKRENYKFWRIS